MRFSNTFKTSYSLKNIYTIHCGWSDSTSIVKDAGIRTATAHSRQQQQLHLVHEQSPSVLSMLTKTLDDPKLSIL